jgi:hypothetical protein
LNSDSRCWLERRPARMGHAYSTVPDGRVSPVDSVRRENNRITADLFSNVGIMLPFQLTPRLNSKIHSYLSRASSRPILLEVHRHYDFGGDNQFPFAFAAPTPTAVIKFAPRASHVYLDYGVFETFRDVPLVALAAAKLEAKRIHVLGQLVQLSEQRLRAFSFMNEIIVTKMREHLAPLCLDFGMCIPSWYRSFKHHLTVCP